MELPLKLSIEFFCFLRNRFSPLSSASLQNFYLFFQLHTSTCCMSLPPSASSPNSFSQLKCIHVAGSSSSSRSNKTETSQPGSFIILRVSYRHRGWLTDSNARTHDTQSQPLFGFIFARFLIFISILGKLTSKVAGWRCGAQWSSHGNHGWPSSARHWDKENIVLRAGRVSTKLRHFPWNVLIHECQLFFPSFVVVVVG